MRRAKIVESMPFGVFKKSNMFQVSRVHCTALPCILLACVSITTCALLQVGDNTEVLYLVASSEFERDSWLKALIQCTFYRVHYLAIVVCMYHGIDIIIIIIMQ